MVEQRTTSVIVVPPDSDDLRSCLPRFDDRCGVLWSDGDALVATGMPVYAILTKNLEAIGILFAQHFCSMETIDKQRLAPSRRITLRRIRRRFV